MNRELETDGVPAPSEFELIRVRLPRKSAEFVIAEPGIVDALKTLVEENARLRGALEQVEFVAGWCPWCECFEYHRFNCARQLALTPPTCDCNKGEEVRK